LSTPDLQFPGRVGPPRAVDYPAQPFYYAAGLVFLALAKAKHMLSGYSTPKVIESGEVQGCVEYDGKLAKHYARHVDVVGKDVLELGPGSDLGVGALLIRAGARSYTAVDRHALIGACSAPIHTALGGLPREVSYVVAPDFQFANRVGETKFDVVLSNAAFEHFDDVPDVAHQLARVVKPGGRICVFIDLKTHSRWIRDKDPTNIYRYSRWLYRLFYFPGQPNRVRPAQYRQAFIDAGFRQVVTSAVSRTDREGRVHGSFDTGDMDQMTVLLEATR
jgi:ubiquinone/menaquinone biosynthesis C-methylase UbiE